MSNQFQPGQQLGTSAGPACVIEEFLGSGGQGEVFRVRVGGQPLALKWYHAEQATAAQREVLLVLIKKGPPSPHFLWPLDLVVQGNRFGYLMPLRDKRFRDANDLMRRRVEPTFRVLATIGLNLAQGFLQLHARGFCYRDISFGNVFFDPKTGDVLICDNDNVNIDGQSPAGVLGTPRFMAPEVARGEAFPDSRTDLYSLAVLLFYLLTLHHPLEGKREAAIRCFDLPAMTKLYGTEPVFIFDPADESNRPVPGVHDNALAHWPLYPEFLRKLFIQSFTGGLRDRDHGRVRESEWRSALARLLDCIAYCPACAVEVFHDPAVQAAPKPRPTCWSCRKPVTLPPVLAVGRHLVMLNHNTKVYPHHLDDQRLYDFSEPWLEVNVHPKDPTRWGLRNLSRQAWQAVTPDGGVVGVEPGRSVGMQIGLRIHFGRCEGELRAP
jgi:DNA-binding helix-hairpin-helix protein with protein kinase domain